MSSPAASAMLPLLKIAVIPIVLLSIYLRNRRQRLKKAEALAQDRGARTEAPRSLLDLSETDTDRLRALLARRDAGERFHTPDGADVSRGMIANRLADALLADGALDEAAALLSGLLAVAPGEDMSSDDRHGALVTMTRLRAKQGLEAEARECLSQAADLQLSRLRQEARGDVLLLAERLADGADQFPCTPALDDPRLAQCGPLSCLRAAGRGQEAQDLTADLIARIDRALAETEGDPSGKVDGFPRHLLIKVRADIARLGQVAG